MYVRVHLRDERLLCLRRAPGIRKGDEVQLLVRPSLETRQICILLWMVCAVVLPGQESSVDAAGISNVLAEGLFAIKMKRSSRGTLDAEISVLVDEAL